MSGYRRFVAYVYEYRKGKKGDNCGFVKVEVRNLRCTLEVHLKCPGLTPHVPCRVYSFWRKDGLMNGILLGSCETTADAVNCRIDTDVEDMGHSKIPLEKMGGMIFTTESGTFFGTEWDDEPIRPENFLEKKIENNAEDHAEDNPGDNALEGAVKKPADSNREEQKPDKPDEEKTDKAEPDEAETQPMESEVTEQISETVTEEAEIAGEAGAPELVVTEASVPSDDFMPFSDGEFLWCRKIKPDDIGRISRRNCALRQNRFVLYGYYNFGYLILCKRRDGQYILGVPGCYDQQERFMANMFGFSFFKRSQNVELPNQRGGYWYRLIDAPNLN